MPPRRRRQPSPFAEAVTFWSVVLIIAAIVGLVSYRVGRDWLGKRLGSVDMAPGAPRIIAQADEDPENTARREREASAPAKPSVTLEDREPSKAERRRVELEKARSEPQDGAELHGRAHLDDTIADDPVATDLERELEPEETPDAPPDDTRQTGPKYTVTAGAFADSANASRTVSKLTSRGYKPYIEKIEKDGQTLYRVNVAVVRGRSNAEALRDEVASTGLSSGIIAGG